jgi:hypothetical protein
VSVSPCASGGGDTLPQTQRIKIESPHRSEAAPTPSNLLRITGAVETPDERMRRVLKTIRSRCFGVLSDDDLELVLGPSHKGRKA